MKKRLFAYILLSALGISLAACMPSTISVEPVPVSVDTVNVQPQEPVRTITVTGSGKVTLTPDIATISIGVQSRDASASAAMQDNNAKAQAIIAVIKNAGVEEKDIQTTNFSIYPQEEYDRDGAITGILYIVNNTVYITVRDLDSLGSLLDTVVGAGANTIGGISFDVADRTEALSQARLAAVEDAKKQANELVEALDVSLGEVQSISYYDTSAPITVMYAKSEMASDASVPIQSGSMDVTTTVNIVFALK